MTQNNESQAHTWGAIVHLASLIWLPLLFIGLKIPLLNILGPLVVWLAKKNQHPFIDDQGKESINFQISFTIWFLLLSFILQIVTPILQISAVGVLSQIVKSTNLAGAGILFSSLIMGLAVLILLGFLVGQLALVIFAAIKAYKGSWYSYPFTMRFLR